MTKDFQAGADYQRTLGRVRWHDGCRWSEYLSAEEIEFMVAGRTQMKTKYASCSLSSGLRSATPQRCWDTPTAAILGNPLGMEGERQVFERYRTCGLSVFTFEDPKFTMRVRTNSTLRYPASQSCFLLSAVFARKLSGKP
jgi:hypothetical protein